MAGARSAIRQFPTGNAQRGPGEPPENVEQEIGLPNLTLGGKQFYFRQQRGNRGKEGLARGG